MVGARGTKGRLKERRRTYSYVKASVFVVLVFVLLGGIAYTARLPQYTVSDVRVEGASRVAAADIQNSATRFLAGSHAFIIPHAFWLAVPERRIVASVIADHPLIADARVSVQGTRMVVTVTERSHYASWCDATCFDMDVTGYIFTPLPAATGRTYRGSVAHVSSTTPLGGVYLGGEFVALDAIITRIASTTKKDITAVDVDQNGDVFATFAAGGHVRFTQDSEPNALVSNIQSVFAAPEFAKGGALEYADFRFSGKAFVKYK